MKLLINKTKRRLAVLLLIASATFNNGIEANSAEMDTIPNTQQTKKRGSAAPDKSEDESLKRLLAENLDKFVQMEYKDETTGQTMSYNLSIPKDYDKDNSYPLVLFIADASTAGKEVKAPLTQGYGGVIWVTDEEQAKHPCFVLVPQYTSKAVNDDFETSDEVEMTIRLLEYITSQYNIDQNRLYTTGQSMGGMMSMYFNISHPDLFAASIFVGCQWDTSKMQHFAQDHFFYIVAAGDEKAPKGMAALQEVLEKENAKISSGEWSAKLPQAEQEENVQKLLSEHNNINFIVFSKGSVLPENGPRNEHMCSFDYAYKLATVRDWLFMQRK